MKSFLIILLLTFFSTATLAKRTVSDSHYFFKIGGGLAYNYIRYDAPVARVNDSPTTFSYDLQNAGSAFYPYADLVATGSFGWEHLGKFIYGAEIEVSKAFSNVTYYERDQGSGSTNEEMNFKVGNIVIVTPSVLLGVPLSSNSSLLFLVGATTGAYQVSGRAIVDDVNDAGDDFAVANYDKDKWFFGPHVGVEFDRNLCPTLAFYINLVMNYYLNRDLNPFNFVAGKDADATGGVNNLTNNNKLSNLMSIITLGVKLNI